MAVTLQHRYLLSGSQLDSPDLIKAAVSHLVPSPTPPDLAITVGPQFTIQIAFSVDHLDADTAAAAALATMEGHPIP